MTARNAYEQAIEALESAEEYFESRADAEYFTDRASPVGNKEMHLLGEMREAIAALKAQK